MTNNNENKDRDRRARQILDEARETLARQPQPYLAPAEPLRYRTTYKPEPEPEPPKLDIAPAPPPMDWWAAIDQRIEQHVEAERGFMLAVVGEALGEALADAREEHHKALADARAEHQKELHKQALELKTGLNGLEDAVRKLAAAEHKTIVDLPALPLSRRDVN